MASTLVTGTVSVETATLNDKMALVENAFELEVKEEPAEEEVHVVLDQVKGLVDKTTLLLVVRGRTEDTDVELRLMKPLLA